MDIETMDGYLARASCPQQMRVQIERLVQSGHGAEGLPVLARHRALLLEELHEVEGSLMCLDQVIAALSEWNR